MTVGHDLEALTVLTFHDGKEKKECAYNGLLSFQAGDLVTLEYTTLDSINGVLTKKRIPVRLGTYVVTPEKNPEKLTVHLGEMTDFLIREVHLQYQDS